MLGEPSTSDSITVRRAVVYESIKTFGWTFEEPGSRRRSTPCWLRMSDPTIRAAQLRPEGLDRRLRSVLSSRLLGAGTASSVIDHAEVHPKRSTPKTRLPRREWRGRTDLSRSVFRSEMETKHGEGRSLLLGPFCARRQCACLNPAYGVSPTQETIICLIFFPADFSESA